MNDEDAREAIEGHRDLVMAQFDGWPDDAPDADYGDEGAVLAAWAYVTGFANSRGMTAEQLFESLGLE